MADYRIKRGFDIRLGGLAENTIVETPFPELVAVKPTDFKGLKAKLCVAEGDVVKIGTPLFYAKHNESIIFTSPASGMVKEIVRGERRRIEAVVIQTDGNKTSEPIAIPVNPEKAEIIKILLQSGLFPAFIQRPFGKLADPGMVPRDIFISAVLSSPLAPDVNVLLEGNETYFQKGLAIISQLTTGAVHLAIDRSRKDLPKALLSANNVKLHRFSGPHPVGNVGVHIHNIAPIKGKKDIVWTCSFASVIKIGRLFETGAISSETIIAANGEALAPEKRMYYKTIMGASFAQVLGYEQNTRYIAGDVLTGNKMDSNLFVGIFDTMITVIPEPTKSELLGWAMPGFGKLSKSLTFVASFMFWKRKFKETAALHGGARSFVASGLYEEVLPMDIYPVFLIKSILANDFDDMEGLGIYEVIEEDLALCEYVDPSKNEFQKILRDGLDLVEKEG